MLLGRVLCSCGTAIASSARTTGTKWRALPAMPLSRGFNTQGGHGSTPRDWVDDGYEVRKWGSSGCPAYKAMPVNYDPTEPTPEEKKKRADGTLVGTIVSDKMQKTVVVKVDRFKMVPKLRLRFRYSRKFMAHDELEEGQIGDVVRIVPSGRALSKKKRFRLEHIIKKLPRLTIGEKVYG
ncbi:unnamed protein product [Chrysoparadoxa australica]